MYTEIKELVNFLAVYMHYRIPRRRISICMESFANYLVTRFRDNWRPNQPKYGEDERLLAIKTVEGLDEALYEIATITGVFTNDLYTSFPASIFAKCNPGEVTCRVSGYSHVVIVWRGQVDADRHYIPTPIGAAKYFDGNSHNIQNTVLNAYGVNGPLAHERNRDFKPERCVPLDLIHSSDISPSDLPAGFDDISEIPPILFRYKFSDSMLFTMRSFSATRFGSHRPRRDNKNTRRIQHAAAYLAVTNEDTMNEAASASLFDNFPAHYHFATDTENDTANASVVGNQDTVTVPSTFPNTVNINNTVPSMADLTNQAPAVCIRSNSSNAAFDTSINSPPPMHSNCTLTSPNQFASNFPPSSVNSSANYFVTCSCAAPENSGQLRIDNTEFPTHGQSGTPSCNCHAAPMNNNAFRTEYDIWKPLPTLTMNNGNLTETVFVNNYIFDTPMLTTPTESPNVNVPDAVQSFQNLNDPDMNDLQCSLSNLSFLDMSPQQSPPIQQSPRALPPQPLPQMFLTHMSPQVLPPQVSQPQVFSPQPSPQRIFMPRGSPSPVQPLQTFPPQLPSQQMLPQQSMPIQPMPRQALPSQLLPIQPIPPQSMPMQSMSPHALSPQPIPIQPVPPHALSPQSMPIQPVPPHALSPQSMPTQPIPPQVMSPQMMPPQTPMPYGLPPQISRLPKHLPQNRKAE